MLIEFIFNKFIKEEYFKPFCLAKAFILDIHKDLNSLFLFFQKRDKVNKYDCQKSFIIVPKLIKKLLPSI